ncbi:MAG: geranylgeranyl reductase family protein [Bacteroidia bacterium]
MSETLHTRILILGAGPGGSSAALFLAKAGIDCLLVDKATFPRDKICGDALSGKVVEVLKKLDSQVVQHLAADPMALGSWGVTFVAPNRKALRVPFRQQYDKGAEQSPGYIAKRLDFDDFLVRECRQRPQIQLVEGLALTAFERKDGKWHCKAEDGREVVAELVIVADGAHSRFAKQVAGIEMEPKHHCAGLRAYYRGVKGLDDDNFIELHFIKDFLPGYFWIFPLPNGMANVGVGMRTDKVSARKVNLKKGLQELISNDPVMRERFADAELVGDIRGFGLPLGSKRRKISGEGYMLVGDAASLIDPFTGEGIGNALYSGMFAAVQAAECLRTGDFSEKFMAAYDQAAYARLWEELQLGYRMQRLVNYPWLFNLVVNKATKNRVLRETISCMFEDLDMRERLKNPMFYLKLLFAG